MGTVGAIVFDSYGHLAAGGSTGGPTGKVDGRVGDTATLSAGLYADARLSVLWFVTGCICMAWLCPSRTLVQEAVRHAGRPVPHFCHLLPQDHGLQVLPRTGDHRCR
ncbi:hypothetical protein B0T26DRAFT_731141 [Lasiosphaeria miniovina]|uniref:Asparaginase n=1 Tax=Lasiosphaeria miniovina TaxID=1954250 RepID=A0AA39ZTM1_9PEZI|nr:uncharacterized protein B0T26DRAFT_731141 [Lasiosphaeria miniovina]KAK0703392.1 hypothetical protein B0T26DRAFT_731141 [Lasiosphaeria miniovina]